jgi:hypothetical protein
MHETRNYSVYPSNLDITASFQKLQDHLSKMRFTENLASGCDQVAYWVRLPGNRRLCAQVFSEFLDVLHEFPNPESISIHSHWKAEEANIGITIDIRDSGIEVGVTGHLSIISGLHERIRDIFKASNPEPQKSPSLSRYNLKKSIFLAHRFDDEGNRTSRPLNTFLRRLGFDVLEGEGYEARDIPGKVADRIQSQDIFILLATKGDMLWILGEAAYAKALNKYLIILVQDDVTLKKGIIGTDHKHIPFPEENIEKAFNDLLYALPR